MHRKILNPALIPVFKSFALMNVAVALTGLTFGIVDMGVQDTFHTMY